MNTTVEMGRQRETVTLERRDWQEVIVALYDAANRSREGGYPSTAAARSELARKIEEISRSFDHLNPRAEDAA